MATADEEAGGFFGAGWLVENRPDPFEVGIYQTKAVRVGA